MVRIFLVVARTSIMLYLCWIYWRFADAVGATAGGKTADLEEWSRLQIRLAYLLLATFAMNLVSQGWEWLLERYLLDSLAPPFE